MKGKNWGIKQLTFTRRLLFQDFTVALVHLWQHVMIAEWQDNNSGHAELFVEVLVLCPVEEEICNIGCMIVTKY